MKVLLMYHSSVGNTKLLSNLICSVLAKTVECDIFSVESLPSDLDYNDYDAYVIGFPTYHSRPSEEIMKHFNSIQVLKEKKPAFIFTTCGWYSANALRIFVKVNLNKGIYPLMSRSYKCIATDGILIAPMLKFLFDFDRKLPSKIERDSKEFVDMLENQKSIAKIPRFKLYSIINYPNAVLGQKYTFKINLNEDKCIQCGRCVRECNVSAFSLDSNGYPEVDRKKCVNCYRCIHHCPVGALSIYKRRFPTVVLNEEFYHQKRDEFSKK